VITVRSITKAAAVVCLLLTLWSAVALVSHHHANATDALKCTVCLAAHSAAAAAIFTVVVVVSTPRLAVSTELLAGHTRAVPFALYVRPPPEA